MIAVIQDISLRWTKQSRSAEGATARRAAARDRFPVSEVSDVGPPPGSSVGAGRPEASPAAGLRLLRHHVSLAEEDGFRPMHGGTWDDWPDGKVHRMPGLAIRVTRNAVEVTWAWEWSCGAPEPAHLLDERRARSRGRVPRRALGGDLAAVVRLEDGRPLRLGDARSRVGHADLAPEPVVHHVRGVVTVIEPSCG
jgi:hypothetical protein